MYHFHESFHTNPSSHPQSLRVTRFLWPRCSATSRNWGTCPRAAPTTAAWLENDGKWLKKINQKVGECWAVNFTIDDFFLDIFGDDSDTRQSHHRLLRCCLTNDWGMEFEKYEPVPENVAETIQAKKWDTSRGTASVAHQQKKMHIVNMFVWWFVDVFGVWICTVFVCIFLLFSLLCCLEDACLPSRCRLTNVNTFLPSLRPTEVDPNQTFPPIFWSRNGCTAAQRHDRKRRTFSVRLYGRDVTCFLRDLFRPEAAGKMRDAGIRDALKSANCCNWFCFQLMHLKKLAKSFLACICGMSVPVVSLGPQVWMQQSVPVPRVDTGCKPFIRCNAWLVCNSYQTKSAS